MKPHLQVTALQQNFQQARALEVVQWLMPQTDEKGLIRALLQQGAKAQGLLCVDVQPANEWLNAVEPFIARLQKVFEAESASCHNHKGLIAACVVGATRSEGSPCSARSSGMHTLVRITHGFSHFPQTEARRLLQVNGVFTPGNLGLGMNSGR